MKRKSRAAVPWAYCYAFPRLRRANLTAHQSGSTWQDKGDKEFNSTECCSKNTAGVQPQLVMGFPPHHRFPPTGTPKPRCAPRRRGFTYEALIPE
jgi:hypothetical protein